MLCALMHDPDQLESIASLIGPDDFYFEDHGETFRAISDVVEVGDAPNPVRVQQQLASRRSTIIGRDPLFLVGLYDRAPTGFVDDAEQHARAVLEQAQRRRIIDRSRRAERIARDPAHTVEDAAALVGFEATTSRFKIRDFGMAELEDADLAVEWLVRHVVTRGEPMIVGGPRKALKTSTLCDLAVSLATGSDFLGRFKVEQPVRVGMISAESGQRTIRETLRRVAVAKGWGLRFVERLRVAFDLPKLNDPTHLAAVRAWIRRERLDVAILDPAYLMLGGGEADERSVFSMGAALRRLVEAVQGLDCSPVIAHHTTKPTSRTWDPLELDDLAFAGFAEFARQWFLVNRREKYTGEHRGQHRLWFTFGGSAGHSGTFGLDVDEGVIEDGRHWSVEVRDVADVRREARSGSERAAEVKRDQRRGEYCRALREHPGGETRRRLREVAGLSGTAAGPIEAELLRENLVEAVDVQRGNGRSYDGLRPTAKLLDNGHHRDDWDAVGRTGTVPVGHCSGTGPLDGVPVPVCPSGENSLGLGHDEGGEA